MLAFAVSMTVLATASCAGRGGDRRPDQALARFASAVRAKRYREAYRRLSEDYRRRVSLADFRRYLKNHEGEAEELSELLSKQHDDIEITAEANLPGGEKFRLVYEGKRWRIVGNVVDFYDQSTPRAALRSFVRAMERRRYDVVMRFVPKPDLEGMSPERMKQSWEGDAREEIERLIANLQAHLDNPIEEVGDRATMPYGDRFAVQFVREGDVWKIEDPD